MAIRPASSGAPINSFLGYIVNSGIDIVYFNRRVQALNKGFICVELPDEVSALEVALQMLHELSNDPEIKYLPSRNSWRVWGMFP